ncbi:hypothetical protein F5B20DRAFT_540866 [Whalleya microplaca]|nr:hypothetical protein F5B20DRAFT_540866 [Whalleya microplaca]
MHFSAAILLSAILGLAAAYPAGTAASESTSRTTSTSIPTSTPTGSSSTGAKAALDAVTLQFEIDNDTFTSNTKCEVGGSVKINREIISATIAGSGDGVTCTASLGNGKTVDFTDAELTKLAGGKKILVKEVACQGA